MTMKITSNKRHVLLSSNAVMAMVVGTALGWFSCGAAAQKRNASAQSIAAVTSARSSDLEKAFWVCDHAAIKHGVDGTTAIACSVITEDLKVKKFNGDFNSMLAWWRQNKAVEHQARTTAGDAVSGR